MAFITSCFSAFMDGWRSHPSNLQKTPSRLVSAERKMRNRLSEKQVDEMVDESFPASDAPTTY
ncbi:hypothetical protein GC177_04170 [bacterium]|nr:hypothetical protein [bacterium]